MGYQIATEGFFDKFKKNKPSIPTKSRHSKPKQPKYDYTAYDTPEYNAIAKKVLDYLPCNAIVVSGDSDGVNISRIGGSTFIPTQLQPVPDTVFVAQINLKDLKYNPHLPKSGLIQFYMGANDPENGAIVFISEKDFGVMTERIHAFNSTSIKFKILESPNTTNLIEVTKHVEAHHTNVFGPPTSWGDSITEIPEYDSKFPAIFTLAMNGMSLNFHMRKGAIKNAEQTQIISSKNINIKYDT